MASKEKMTEKKTAAKKTRKKKTTIRDLSKGARALTPEELDKVSGGFILIEKGR